jgi:hypothetical protein
MGRLSRDEDDGAPEYNRQGGCRNNLLTDGRKEAMAGWMIGGKTGVRVEYCKI